jgi:hypothetical protein
MMVLFLPVFLTLVIVVLQTLPVYFNATNPNGTYTVADLVGPLGISTSGGWTIVIAYSNPSLQLRNLTVFDGSAIMNGGDPAIYVGVSGFSYPPAGPVSCELGSGGV